ncbi:glycoside hydrolase [Termitidicoccus mucosus]|uniref:Sialidase domain-containing protein n=1 Tax=Termitidicoccus mucosus TaxID=1184151 RepID=A0A178IPY0_9BACT|nr:hypothetical protein AW736_04020 [Opitutaceae bacterium TSB47]
MNTRFGFIRLQSMLLATILSPVILAVPRDGADKAPGALFSHEELRARLAYSVVSARSKDSPGSVSASLAELQDGSIFIVWHKFRPGGRHATDFGLADIACKTSRDGGKTWTGERILFEPAPGDINIQAPAVCALPNGDLLIAALRAHAKNSTSMCLFRSRDGGLTWEDKGTIWERSSGQWLQGGTPGIVRLSTGRLVLPFHFGKGDQGSQSNQNAVGCYLSDDDGLSWRRASGDITLPMRGAMEASVCEMANGRLLVSLRTQLGSPFLAESADGGETWSKTWSSGLTGPESSTCLRRIPGTQTLILVWNDCEYYEPRPMHSHFGQRSPLTLAISQDNGRTWRRVGDIESNPACAFTNLNCIFTRAGDAVITYSTWSPPFDRVNMTRADQCAVVIPKAFFSELTD